MSFTDHFDELRVRLIRCLFLFCIGFVIFYFLADPILSILRKPLFDALPPERRQLYFTHLFENFMTHLKIGGYASVFFFSPFYFYQIWAFISPGLHGQERKLVLPFTLAATVFFLAGISFAYFVLFPIGFRYFISYGATTDVPLLTIDSYYGTCLKLLLLFGLAFELPILILLLAVVGLVDAPGLRRQRRTAILMITFFSALFAPPDAISMIMLGAPLILFYEGAIGVVHFLGTKKKTSSKSPKRDEDLPPNPFEGRSR